MECYVQSEEFLFSEIMELKECSSIFVSEK